MTVQEISNRLDTLLNKTSKGIVINEYFKSLYLTQAQTYFVDHTLKAYEYGDNIRHVLGKLLKEDVKVTQDVLTSEDGLIVLALQPDVKQIIFERTNDTIETIPMDFNDITTITESPFRKPNDKIAYRVTFDNQIKLYTSETFLKYYCVYCKVPKPIVLEDLPGNLAIQGLDEETESELPYDSILRVIDIASNLIYKNKARFVSDSKPKAKT